MNKVMAALILTMFAADASAGCISPQEKSLLSLRALVFGTVKLFVSHADLPLGTSVEVIGAATAERVAEINSDTTLVYVAHTWVPWAAPGFEAFVTSAGVEKLYADGFCFGRIN